MEKEPPKYSEIDRTHFELSESELYFIKMSLLRVVAQEQSQDD